MRGMWMSVKAEWKPLVNSMRINQCPAGWLWMPHLLQRSDDARSSIDGRRQPTNNIRSQAFDMIPDGDCGGCFEGSGCLRDSDSVQAWNFTHTPSRMSEDGDRIVLAHHETTVRHALKGRVTAFEERMRFAARRSKVQLMIQYPAHSAALCLEWQLHLAERSRTVHVQAPPYLDHSKRLYTLHDSASSAASWLWLTHLSLHDH